MEDLKELCDTTLGLYNELSNHMTKICLLSKELKIENDFEDIDDDIDNIGDKLYFMSNEINKSFENTPVSFLLKMKKGEPVELSTELLNNKDFMFKAIKQNFELFSKIGSELVKDWQFVSSVIKEYPVFFKYAPQIIKDDYQAAFLAVSKDGNNIQYVNDNLKENHSICFEAVKQDVNVYQLLPEKNRNDKIITKEACKNKNSYANFKYIGKKLMNDLEFVKEMITINYNIYPYLNEKMKNNVEIMKIMIDKHPWNYQIFLDEGKELVLDYAIESFGKDQQSLYRRLPKEMKTPKNIFKMMKHQIDLKIEPEVKNQIIGMFD